MSEGEKDLISVTESFNATLTAVRSVSGPKYYVLLTVMVIVVVVTILGNGLVIVAFKVDKCLRRQCSYYLLNLAISDFLVGAFCVPVYIPYVLRGKWILGRGLCKLWLVMDYVLCCASVFNIVLISYDRFQSVTRPVSYHARQGKTYPTIIKMIVVWVLAFILYGPAIIFWDVIVGQSHVPEDECLAEFSSSWYFLLTASTFEFFCPFISVAFFNISIYLKIRRRMLHSREEQHRIQVCMLASAQLSNNCGVEMNQDLQGSVPSQNPSPQHVNLDHPTDITARPSRLYRDRKIAKTLAIIVFVFAICWAPYTLLMIICAACKEQCIQNIGYKITFWLLWINSALNPFLYFIRHSSFRRAFGKILCPKRRMPPHSPDFN
ncbi:histamine H3 receptor-like [Thalassophryne amazonica]|uniref:histamine H3 receptor-like n=1 Tax=Thalassophryne amazonica TaxID=390379 RepID=UPI001470ACD7|nr:histamine H3 receptor-like [Thalassophryne amazonica]